MKNKFRIALFVTAVLCATYINTFGALVADLNPPSWRGQDGTTIQSWSFLNDDILPIADSYSNLYGIPTVSEEIVGTWHDSTYKQDTWLTDNIIFCIPTNDNASEISYRIQAVWDPSATTPVELRFYLSDTQGNVYQAEIIDDYKLSGWEYTTFELTVENTGNYSLLYFDAYAPAMDRTLNTFINEVIIDTKDVPEPASIILLSVGSIFLKRKHKI